MYNLWCQQCGKVFEWHTDRKKNCPACQKERDAEAHRKYKQRCHIIPEGVPRHKDPKLGPRTQISKKRREIMEMVKEGKSLVHIAVKIGFSVQYLEHTIRNRVQFIEIRRALDERERLQLHQELYEMIRQPACLEFEEATAESMKATGKAAAWLFG